MNLRILTSFPTTANTFISISKREWPANSCKNIRENGVFSTSDILENESGASVRNMGKLNKIVKRNYGVNAPEPRSPRAPSDD